MVMDGFSTILVTVPLLIPFAAQFVIQPFHMAMMFLLNMEIGYLSPPLGQNLFVTSFRFNKPMLHLYRICLPFLGIMVLGLVIVVGIPKISTFAVQGDIAAAKARAAQFKEPPREAWLMECVQEDRNNPKPCTEEEKKIWGYGDDIRLREEKGQPPAEEPKEKDVNEMNEEELFEKLLEGEGKGGTEAAPSGSAAPGAAPSAEGKSADDELLEEMLKE
jgi:hypothetical protein